MQFKGHLLLPDETGPGLRVNLDVAEYHLAVESDGGGLGAWPLEVVGVERRGDVFDLTVAGEALRFLADDTIAFAYTGVPTIEKVSGGRRSRGHSTFRSFLDRLWNGREEMEPPTGLPARPDEPIDDPFGSSRGVESVDPVDVGFPTIEVDDVVEIDGVDNYFPSVVDQEPADVGSGVAVCPAVRSDGRPCESTILTESGYCYPHDPKRVFSDKYKAAQEARAQLRRDATGRLNRVYGRLEKAMRQVERGELDPEVAMAMAQLARTMCAILEVDESGSERRP